MEKECTAFDTQKKKSFHFVENVLPTKSQRRHNQCSQVCSPHLLQPRRNGDKGNSTTIGMLNHKLSLLFNNKERSGSTDLKPNALLMGEGKAPAGALSPREIICVFLSAQKAIGYSRVFLEEKPSQSGLCYPAYSPRVPTGGPLEQILGRAPSCTPAKTSRVSVYY